jgi:hypothetical protein
MPRAFSVFHCTRQYRVTLAQVFNGIQQTALYPLQNKMERVLQLGRTIERQRRFRPSSTPAFAGLLCDGSLFLVLASDVDIRWSLVSRLLRCQQSTDGDGSVQAPKPSLRAVDNAFHAQTGIGNVASLAIFILSS